MQKYSSTSPTSIREAEEVELPSPSVDEMTMPKPTTKPNKSIKAISLVVLTFQNAALLLSMQYASKNYQFISTTAVLMAEVLKLLASLLLVYLLETSGIPHFVNLLYTTIIKNPIDTLKVMVPCIIYVVQNNLMYLAAHHVDAASLQVTYQIKILTTAFFTVLILRRTLTYQQWVSLLMLLSGVILVTLSNPKKEGKQVDEKEQNRLLGFAAALAACMLSGLAGVYFEKILKGSDISVWMRNVQLSILSIPIAMISSIIIDWNKIQEKGYFGGYSLFVVYLIFLQAFGGLLVAVVVKYADNILKGFATSLSIILSSILSIYIFDFQIKLKFILGAILVMVSVFLYNVPIRQTRTPIPRTYEQANREDKIEV